MTRPFNFSAGPATLPVEVLEQAAAEMLDWHGTGMSVMEMSHRGAAFTEIAHTTESDLREVLGVPAGMRVLFMQGGAIAENAIVPLNLSRGATADYVVTGAWSHKSQQEARKYCTVRIAANTQDSGYTTLPAAGQWQLSAHARYVHVCSNETIHGVQWQHLPDLTALGSAAPLVVDCSSDIGSKAFDWEHIGLAYAGAQKNMGPAGLTLVLVREELLGHALPACPSAFDYKVVADHGSMYNTPPTYAIYIMGLVLQWMKRQTYRGAQGLQAVALRNADKAALLYQAIDASDGFYVNRVQPACRSVMNIPFFLASDALHAAFVQEAQAQGLMQLKGHKAVGGVRASLYNALPLEGVQALVSFMKDFARRHG